MKHIVVDRSIDIMSQVKAKSYRRCDLLRCPEDHHSICHELKVKKLLRLNLGITRESESRNLMLGGSSFDVDKGQ